MADEIVLYFSPASRAFMALWMIEELGIRYRLETVDIRKNEQKSPTYLAVNPMGKVPAITIDGVVITETPAICTYLADRYSYGQLAPKLEDPERGPYLRWMVYSTGVVDPGLNARALKLDAPANTVGWGDYDAMVETLRTALRGKDYLFGARFTAADVALGGMVIWGMYGQTLPNDPVLTAYSARLQARPANQKAAALSFGS
ncbi:glutathione S-transferase family protein [Bradyrhizobium genosp. P]|uniref:glutathione S-transferase family protein n=1 Tax=Bradyrhizobium genosp. P TaxID=83641 RepID=UPI003CEC061F